MNYLKRNKVQVIFISAGALAGLLYWKFIGCTSGTCPLQSHWAGSMLIGSVLGSLLGDIFVTSRKKSASASTAIQKEEHHE